MQKKKKLGDIFMIDFEKYLIPAMEASNQTKNNQLPVEIKKIYEKMGAKPRTYIKDGRFLLHVGDLLEEGEAPNMTISIVYKCFYRMFFFYF